MATPRQGPQSAIYRYREASWGVDPATPTEHLIPFISDGFQIRQPRIRGQFYDGQITSKGSYLDVISAQGPINTSMDYDYVGYDLADVLGLGGYSRQGTFHKWISMNGPLPHGILKKFFQTPVILHRYPAVVAQNMQFAQATRGQQAYTVNRLGSGDEVLADIAGSTLADNTSKNTNTYFNGQLWQDNVLLGKPAGFDLNIDLHVTGKEGAFSGGKLSAYSVGVPEIRGTLSKIFTTDDGDTFYLQAVNETPSMLICVYANKPAAAAATAWLRIILPRVLFDRMATAAGGDTIPDQTQTFYADTPASTVYFPGHAIGTIAGTYNITAADNVVSIKADGGGVINVTLTNGAARTTDQIVAELNADGTFNVAAVAYNFLNRVEIRSLSAVTGSSIQWQTGTANSAHVKLGFDNTTWSGYAPSPIYVELQSLGTSADYT